VDVLSAASQGPIPYWTVAWPAGLGLARVLAREDLRGMRILEVGAGVGVSGLGAAVGGAEVLVTDNVPAALRVAVMNARRNALHVRAAAADWRHWPFRPDARFDRIIGSDVTYEPAAFDALLTVMQESLKPGGDIWLTDPGRIMTSAFQQRALAEGWCWSTATLPHEGRQAVFLYTFRRRNEKE